MTPSISGFLSRNKLAKWWKARQEELRLEYARKEQSLTIELDNKYHQLKESIQSGQESLHDRLAILKKENDELNYLKERNLKLKADLEKANQDLREQITLIEAKARPDQVWSQAFSTGFSKAWDMMTPMMRDGIEKIKEKTREDEIDASLGRVNLMVDQRIKELGSYELKTAKALDEKRKEFQVRLQRTKDTEELKKIKNYLQVIDWITSNGH